MSTPFDRYNFGLFNSGTYTPTIVDIAAITQTNPALVTTTIANTFVIGQQVQFFIPPQWGMRQLQALKGYIITQPSNTQFTVNIDTSQFDAFVVPVVFPPIVIDTAQVAGIGDQNSGTSSPGGIPANPNTIPGASQNQAP